METKPKSNVKSLGERLAQLFSPQAPAKRIKVLVIEDEPDMVKILELLLKDRGFDMVSAIDGEAGLQKVETEKPDLILLDLMLPKVDGTEVAERLRKNPQTHSIPIIFLTALAQTQNETEKAALTKGNHNMILGKPFRSEQLFILIEQALQAKSKQTAQGS